MTSSPNQPIYQLLDDDNEETLIVGKPIQQQRVAKPSDSISILTPKYIKEMTTIVLILIILTACCIGSLLWEKYELMRREVEITKANIKSLEQQQQENHLFHKHYEQQLELITKNSKDVQQNIQKQMENLKANILVRVQGSEEHANQIQKISYQNNNKKMEATERSIRNKVNEIVRSQQQKLDDFKKSLFQVVNQAEKQSIKVEKENKQKQHKIIQEIKKNVEADAKNIQLTSARKINDFLNEKNMNLLKIKEEYQQKLKQVNSERQEMKKRQVQIFQKFNNLQKQNDDKIELIKKQYFNKFSQQYQSTIKNTKQTNHQEIQKIKNKSQQLFNKIGQDYSQKAENIQKDTEHLNERLQIGLVEFYKIKKQVDDKFFTLDDMSHRVKDLISFDSVFRIPKYIWVYSNTPVEKETLINQCKMANKIAFASESGFKLQIVNKNNFDAWLTKQKSQQLKSAFQDLQSKKGTIPELKNDYQTVVKTLIMLNILNRLGGIYMDKQYILTQNFNWLENIKSNIHINTGNSYAYPKVFGFYSPTDSSSIQKQNKQSFLEVDKYIVYAPALRSYFLAAIPGSQFMSDVIKQYIKHISNPQQMTAFLESNQIKTGKIRVQDLRNAFTLASTVVIQLKQRILDESMQKYKIQFKKFAIDEYGLFSMNAHYFPQKLQLFFNNHQPQNNFRYVSKMPLSQLQDSTGPLRYLIKAQPNEDAAKNLNKAINNKEYEIIQGSLFHKLLFFDKGSEIIKLNKENLRKTIEPVIWESLPKIFWLYKESESDSTSIKKLCQMNLKSNALAASYSVNQVTQGNIQTFLSNSQQLAIQRTLSTVPAIYSNFRSQLYRLALLSVHGGVYIDTAFVLLQDLDWITNIAKEPAKFIFNRFGKLPKILMQFSPLYGSIFNWEIDLKYNTKTDWHFGFQDNFIVAEKDSQFLKDWFQMFNSFILSNHSSVHQLMKDCKMDNKMFTSQKNRTLLVIDALKATLGCKQSEIQTSLQSNQLKNPNIIQNKTKYSNISNVMQYYGMWSINGFTGFQKYRTSKSSSDSSKNSSWDNISQLLYRNSQQYSDRLLGKVYKGIQLHDPTLKVLNKLIEENKDNIEAQAHPQSIFMKYVFNANVKRLFSQKHTSKNWHNL